MKKGGVINQPLSAGLAGLGHGDYFLICDAGFPIPKDVERIDLALAFNIPSLRQCLCAVIEEIVVQKVTIACEMDDVNKKGADYLRGLFRNQEFSVVPQAELTRLAKGAKFIVRTGELAPYSNLLLGAASGVEEYKQDLML